jgi:peptidoglycan/LPS O-acetylase OafA/YrhL
MDPEGDERITAARRPQSPARRASHGQSRGRIPYEPPLDGLRGVSVLAVLFYHAELSWAPGGFLGVEAFFVLSGYLITTLLLTEWRQTGSIDLVAFWGRRARRLLPALFVLLAAIAGYAALIASPSELGRIRGDALSTLAYINNWWQILAGHSYFDQFETPSPLRHAWSLAIEEQWYVVWPLIVMLVMRQCRSERALLVVSLILAAGSALAMDRLFESFLDPSRVYYGTDTRAQALLFGAALSAVRIGRRETRKKPPVWSVAGGSACALAIGVIWVLTPDHAAWLYRGGFLLHAALVAVFIHRALQPGPNLLRRVLSWAPLRGLGMISYGVYLWHWPIFLVLTRSRTGLDGITLLAIRLLATLVISLLSYWIVEQPIRRGALAPRPAIALGAVSVVALVAVLLVATSIPMPGPGKIRPATQASQQAPTGTEPTPRALTPTRVLLVGDSTARSLGAGFIPSIERESGVELINRALFFCGLSTGSRRTNGRVLPDPKECANWPSYWRSYVDRFQPNLTILYVGGLDVFDRKVAGNWLVFGSEQFDAHFLDLLARATDILSSGGVPMVLLTTPSFGRLDEPVTREWRPEARWRTEHLNSLLRLHARREPDRVQLLDLEAFVCGGAACPAKHGDVALRFDGVHYSARGARLIARWLAPQLRRLDPRTGTR